MRLHGVDATVTLTLRKRVLRFREGKQLAQGLTAKQGAGPGAEGSQWAQLEQAPQPQQHQVHLTRDCHLSSSGRTEAPGNRHVQVGSGHCGVGEGGRAVLPRRPDRNPAAMLSVQGLEHTQSCFWCTVSAWSSSGFLSLTKAHLTKYFWSSHTVHILQFYKAFVSRPVWWHSRLGCRLQPWHPT